MGKGELKRQTKNPGGVLCQDLGGGVPPGSYNGDPAYDRQKLKFVYPVYDRYYMRPQYVIKVLLIGLIKDNTLNMTRNSGNSEIE